VIKSRYSKRFAELVEERKQQLIDALCAGLDHETYVRNVGQLWGLNEAVALSEQVDREMSGD